MGCWGITAFESDTGLDAVSFVREYLPEDGKLELRALVSLMQNTGIPKPKHGYSHTGPMAVTEILQKYIAQDTGDLDYDADWAAGDNKFSALTSFTADKESIQWLRDYLSDTLNHTIADAAARAGLGGIHKYDKWGGWFKEDDWQAWQKHMGGLVDTLDNLLASQDVQIELVQPPEQENGFVMDGIT